MLTAHSSSVRNAEHQRRLPSLGVILFFLTMTLVAGARMTRPLEAAPRLRTFNPAGIVLPDGYQIETVAIALDAPTPAVFQGNDSPGGSLGFQTSAFVAMFGTFPAFLSEGESPSLWLIYPKGNRALRPNGPVLVPPPDKTLGGGQLAAALALGAPSQDLLRIIGLVVGSFVIALGTMALVRRYWMQ